MTGYPDFQGRKVTVMGLGIEGVDLVRFLAAQGAEVTVSDAKTEDRLISRLQQLEGLPVRLSLGANAIADVERADVVFVSQGVPLTIPALTAARERGIPFSSMTRLFLEMCPGPVIGITGSSGKTTAASLVDAMLEAAGRPHVLGGNVGVGLLGLLDGITADTWVVLEISHTQLELTDRSPHIACVLNVTPNHLDRYSWPDYVALKRNLLRYQSPDNWAVLNYDNAETRAMASQAVGEVAFFSGRGPVPGDGVFLRDGAIVQRCRGRETPVLPVSDIPLRGDHNVENVAAAAAVAALCGVEPEAIATGVRSFRPVPHRLELVAQVHGAAYYNDSIATTPERALAGLRSFTEPMVLLLGGREKHLPLADLAREACRRCRAVVLFGEAAPVLEEALRAAAGEGGGCGVPFRRVQTLREAVEAARAEARPGDVVLLSPACTSFDAYDNFEERGEDFRRIVRELTKSQGG
jgi:UDP-N-acetylmuramoylalanine--D-glutamate ligase